MHATAVVLKLRGTTFTTYSTTDAPCMRRRHACAAHCCSMHAPAPCMRLYARLYAPCMRRSHACAGAMHALHTAVPHLLQPLVCTP
jgi:hypothetical protein